MDEGVVEGGKEMCYCEYFFTFDEVGYGGGNDGGSGFFTVIFVCGLSE